MMPRSPWNRAASCVSCLVLAMTTLSPAAELPELRVRTDAKIVNTEGQEEPGTVLERRADGTVVFQPAGSRIPVSYQKDQYRRLIPAITAAEVIDRRAAILLAEDAGDRSVEILRTIRWGLAREDDEDALRATADLASAAVERYPADVRIASAAIELLRDRSDALRRIEGIVRTALAENPAWSDGYRILADVLIAGDRREELIELLGAWLERQPTSRQANLLMAEHAEAAGRLEEARQAYFKAFTFHDHREAGWHYARLSVTQGRLSDAGEAARRLLEMQAHEAGASAVLGIVNVHDGNHQTARELLVTGLAGDLPEDLRRIARYNLGLANYHLRRRGEAIAIWRESDSPAARLALAIVNRETVRLNRLPDGPLRAVGRELNACLSLERKDFRAARRQLEGGLSERHLFLNHVADLLANNADGESMATLAQHSGSESLHWQLYGHLLAQRYDAAQAILDRLPEGDGYAAVCRVYLAEARGNRLRARELFRDLGGVQGAPPAYLARLEDEFGNENDRLRAYDFDWPDGFNLSEGWDSRSTGTGVLVQVTEGRLVLSGTQTPASEPVSRAWCLVSPAKLSEFSAELTIAGVAEATVGIELLDEEHANGIAYGVRPDGQFAWRALARGRWGGWNELDRRVDGGSVTLRIDYDHRLARILLRYGDAGEAVGEQIQLATPYLSTGVFGVADPGVTWRLAVDSVRLRLKPPPGAAADDRGTRRGRGR